MKTRLVVNLFEVRNVKMDKLRDYILLGKYIHTGLMNEEAIGQTARL